MINGSLIAVLLMRLKIGKICFKKSVEKIGDVRDNWDNINKLCLLRGYEAFKPVVNILHSNSNPDPRQLVNILMHILNIFKSEHVLKSP